MNASVQPDDKLERALRAAATGELDRLSVEQVELMERVANTNPTIAARLADRRPPRDLLMDVAEAALDPRTRPTPGSWEEAWARIDLATAGTSVPKSHVSRRSLAVRLWRPLAAAAASLLLIILVNAGSTATGDAWPLVPATEVEITDLVVYDDATTFVFSTGGENGFEVVWVLEEES